MGRQVNSISNRNRAAHAQSTTTSALPIPTSCSGVSSSRFQYTVSSGWQVTKILGNLKQPRSIVFDSAGQMVVVEVTSGISVHTFGSNGCVNSSKTILSDSSLNHGLSLTPDGKKLYASSPTTVWEWDYDATQKTLANRRTVVQGMSSAGHNTRTTHIVPQKPQILLVQVGSNSNLDFGAAASSSGRSCLRAFDMTAVPSGGYQYNTAGYLLGYGMRNEVAFTFDPNGMVWGAENSADQLTRDMNGQSIDIHIDNPAEEINYSKLLSDNS
jgi:glucose/arabinose dehydrogenase